MGGTEQQAGIGESSTDLRLTGGCMGKTGELPVTQAQTDGVGCSGKQVEV